MRARLTRTRRSTGRFFGQLIIKQCTVGFCVSLLGARQPKKLNLLFQSEFDFRVHRDCWKSYGHRASTLVWQTHEFLPHHP